MLQGTALWCSANVVSRYRWLEHACAPLLCSQRSSYLGIALHVSHSRCGVTHGLLTLRCADDFVNIAWQKLLTTRSFILILAASRAGVRAVSHLEANSPADQSGRDRDTDNGHSWVERTGETSSANSLLDAAAFQPVVVPLPTVDASSFLERLSRAIRPLILTGLASLTRFRRDPLAALDASTGIPVIRMESPRGISDASLGAFAQALAQSDCVLLLGKRPYFTLKFGVVPAFAANCEFLQIDAEQHEIARSKRAVASLLTAAEADTPPGMQALIAASVSSSKPDRLRPVSINVSRKSRHANLPVVPVQKSR